MIKYFIGSVSKNVVDSIIDFDGNFGFIPSRRQIDYNGGYVNNWTTGEFAKYVNGRVPIERDHGGIGQGYKYDDRYARIYSYSAGNNYTIGLKFTNGKTGTTWMNIKGDNEIDGNFNDTSDISLKEKVVALGSTWNTVKQLKPCTFDWKPVTDLKDSSNVINPARPSVGFIA